VVSFIGLATLVIAARLAQLQVLNHDRYASEARLTHISQEILSGRRGALLDQTGYPLAASVDTYNIMVEKRAWADPTSAHEAAQSISALTGVPAAEMLATMAETEVFEIAVARDLNFEQATEVRKLGLEGVRLLQGSRRYYPEGSLAAQLVGLVGQDHVGLTGLEADLDVILGGAKGSLTFERDGLGNELAVGDRQEIPAQPGSDVVLTIDRFIQRVAERELDKAIDQHEAAGGSVIVVEPRTGRILAMASRPSFDLTKPDLSDESKLALFRNPAITDQYEPGSVFKLVTVSAAIDSGIVGPYAPWYDEGVVNVSDWSIYNWDFSANGDQDVTQILVKSLNTGAAWLADLTGPGRFYDYVARFGFGEATGSGLAGEAPGKVRTPENDPNWRAVDVATNSFGQGISVTPLQMAMAVAAIANDGLLMKPQIVREIISPAGRQTVETEPVRQVITPDTARTMRDMMGVVVDGIPSIFLDVPGYRVGGKTGTANIVTADGGYKAETYISSFAGVAPLDDPAIAVLVKIDEPKGVPWGTVVAAPTFASVAEAALTYLKVPPREPALVSELQ
jgi:cell division protein FtsI/penicillin-binding protein 2